MSAAEATAAGTLTFRLLGPLEVWRAGRAVKVGGERQRALLAVLLLHANEVVPAERLIEELYHGDPSGTAANALQAAVSRLRRVLDTGAGGPALVTRAPGYMLSAAPEQIDLALFERLAAEGRAALAGGDASRAAAILREALALWRGPPLADLELIDSLQSEIRRLEELRLAVSMDRIDADLESGNADSVIPELEALVEAHPLQERLRGQLMLALYRAGRQADALAAYRALRTMLRDELGLEPTRALQQLERAILKQDAAIDARTSGAEEVVVCPFKGLASFDADDAMFFCGREDVVAELVSRLVDSALVGVVGASGVGKSSIVRAGILEQLRAGVLPGSERRRIALIRPGPTPLAELRSALGDARDERVVVAVDQLEEVFTVCDDDGERVAFLDQLAALAADPARRTLVVVALRADFYGRCAASPAFAEVLSRHHALVGTMTREQLARAIEVPAARAGLEAERRLVEELVGDVAGAPGGLPLLSTTLLELWRRREGRLLRLESYRALGGVRGAVARLAETTYAELSPAARDDVRSVMLRLTVGEGEKAARRRVPLVELTEPERRVLERLADARLVTIDDGAVEVAHEALLREWPRLQQWLEDDRDARRLHAHLETAAREWDERGRDPAELYRGARLSAALDWAESHDRELAPVERAFMEASRDARERELVLQRRRARRLLALVVGVGALLVLAVAAGIVALVQRSHARHEATVALARELGATAVSEPRIDRAMLLAREAVALSPSPATEGTLLATLLRSPAAIATFTGPIDSRPQSLALSPDGRTLAVSDNTGTVRFYDPVDRRPRALIHNLGFTSPVTYSRDGSVFAAFGQDAHGVPDVEIRQAGDLHLVRTMHWDKQFLEKPTGRPSSLVFSPDARALYLAYSLQNPDGSDGPAYIDRWDVRSGRLVSTTAVGTDGSWSLKLFDGGRTLAVLGPRDVSFLDARTMRRIRAVRLPVRPNSLFGPNGTLSPDGRTAVVQRTAGVPTFIDLRTRRVTPGLGSDAAPISGMAFAPDGRTLVSGGEDGAVIVWDAATGRVLQRLTGHASRVLGIAFGADGRTLFTCSLDGAIFEWDLGGHRRFGRSFTLSRVPALPRLGPDAAFHPPPLAVSPDGARYAVRVGSASIAIYSSHDARRLRRWSPPVGPEVTGLAWSAHGLLAVTGDSGVLQLWSATTRPRLVRRLRGLASFNKQPEVVTAAAFSPDGALLAAGDVDHTPGMTPYRFGTVAVWNASTGRLAWRHRSRRGTVNVVAFSPDGKLLAAGYENGVVVLYDARSGAPLRTLSLEGGGDFSFETLAFSPTGLLATGTWAGIVQLWDPHSGREIGRPTLVAAAPVASIAFDPTGQTFATTGGSDGLVKLWRTSTLQQFGTTFPGDPGQWSTARYAMHGRELVVLHEDGTGEIWPTSLAAWERHACSVAGRNLTREEWRRFVGNRRYDATCD